MVNVVSDRTIQYFYGCLISLTYVGFIVRRYCHSPTSIPMDFKYYLYYMAIVVGTITVITNATMGALYLMLQSKQTNGMSRRAKLYAALVAITIYILVSSWICSPVNKVTGSAPTTFRIMGIIFSFVVSSKLMSFLKFCFQGEITRQISFRHFIPEDVIDAGYSVELFWVSKIIKYSRRRGRLCAN